VQQDIGGFPAHSQVRMIDGAGATFRAVRSDGTVQSWGAGGQGQLGNATNTASQSRSTSVLAPSGGGSLDRVRDISGGPDHVVAVRADGTVWAWGRNDWGQLGDGTQLQRTRPVQVSDSATPTWLGLGLAIASGGTHSVAIRADGSTWSWGDDQLGQLGLAAVPAVCAGGRPCAARATPAQLAVGSGYRAVAGGSWHSMALAADGTVFAWGDNRDGQLGVGLEDGNTSTPLRVLRAAATPLDGVVAIAGSASNGIALRADGSVWAWGDNDRGQLGQGSLAETNYAVKVQRSSGVDLVDAIAVAGIDRVVAMLLVDGTVSAVGRNTYGTLGNNTITDASYPVTVQQVSGANLDRVTTLVGNGGDTDHVQAIRDDGTLWAWGINDRGQLGLGSNVGPSTCGSDPCSRRARQVLAMSGIPMTGVISSAPLLYGATLSRDDGSVWAWGSNPTGQLGNSTTSPAHSFYPTRVSDNASYSSFVAGATAVAGNDFTPSALLGDGRLVSWGENIKGQTGIGTTDSPSRFAKFVVGMGGAGQAMFSAIASGREHGIARDGSGRIATWGDDYYGQLGACTSTYQFQTWPDLVQWSCGSNRAPNPVEGIQQRSDGTTPLPSGTWTNETTVKFTAMISDPDDAQTVRLFVELRPNHVPLSAACGDTSDTAVYQSTTATQVQSFGSWRTITVTGLTTGTQYHWRACVRDGGGTGASSPWYTPGGDPDFSVDTSTPVSGTYGSRQVAASCGSSAVLLADGTVWTAGDGAYGQLGNGTTSGTSSTPVQVRRAPGGATALTGVRSIALGCGFGVAVLNDGSVYAWGRNDTSQLGSTTSSTCSTVACSEWAVQVDPATAIGVKEVAAGSGFALALRADGRVLAWGSNANGRLGRGTTGGSSATAAPVRDTANAGDLSNITTISAGNGFGVASDADGSAWAWGSNANDRLGAGLTTGTDYPTARRVVTAAATPIAGVKRVEAGTAHALALLDDGSLWAWGDNTAGQLGINSAGGTSAVASPVRDATNATLTRFTQVAAGGEHTTAMRGDGTVWSWGRATSGQLGNNTFAGSSCTSTCSVVPQQLRDGANALVTSTTSMFKSIDAGDRHTVALRASGQPWGWGAHQLGQLGRTAAVGSCPSAEPCSSSLVSTLFSTGTGVLDTGGRSSGGAQLTADGKVQTWGDGFDGQLGNGTANGATPRLQTVEVSAGVPLADITSIGTGQTSTYAVRADGTVWSWGSGASGRLGNNSTARRTRAVQVRSATAASNSGPALVDIVQVAANDEAAYAVDAAGTAWSWGTNNAGDLGSGVCCTSRSYAAPVMRASGVQLTGVTAVAANSAAGDDAFALRSDGTVWGWGQASYGQMGRGVLGGPDTCTSNVCHLYAVQALEGAGLAPLTKVVQIAAADNTPLAIKADGTTWSWGQGDHGKLGNNATVDTPYAIQVRASSAAPNSGTPLANAIDIAAGEKEVGVVDATGAVLTWGYGADGTLGDGTFTGRYFAGSTKLTSGATVTGARSLGDGGYWRGVHVINGVGKVMTTGSNYEFELGDCATANRATYAELRETCSGNVAPTVRGITQYRADHSTTIPVGSWVPDGISNSIFLDFTISDPDAAETVTPYIEFAPVGTALDARCGDTTDPNVRTAASFAQPVAGSGLSVSFAYTGLPVGTQYHWRVCAKDASGATSAWRSFGTSPFPDFGVDNNPPSDPLNVDDGSMRGIDIDETGSLSVLEATWPDGLDGGGSGLVKYDYCVTTSPTGADCAAGAVRAWTSNAYATSLRATGLTLTSGTTYVTCVRAVDGAGNMSGSVVCSDGQQVRFAVTGVAPNAGVQGDIGTLIQITGEGFESTDSVAILGTGVTVQSVTRISSTRLDVVLDIAAGATPGARTVRVEHVGADTSRIDTPAAYTVSALSITLSVSSLGYADPARDPVAPNAISFGTLFPGDVRRIGPTGSGQAVAGAAMQVSVVSNGAWRLQQYATDFSDGTSSFSAGALAWKHNGVAESWTSFSTSSTTVEG
ncbi:MAG: repeat-containing protein, partial [Thermoleophilia bacterium]|nr:repeat-containing protein [Thermoleophilia bacterium]